MASSRRTDPSSSTSLTETPSNFFKVILPATIEEKKMRIPEKFVRRIGDELSDVASLRDSNGQVWHVKLVKDGKEIWFHDGLHDFVKYHSICVGHFLVFKYAKNSNFHVLVFDKTACEVQYPDYCEELNDEKIDNSVEIMGCRTPNPSSSSLRRTYRCVECGASLESKTTKHLNDPDASTQDEHEEEVCRFSRRSSATKSTATTEERERAIEATKAFESANPFCSVVMRSTYVQNWCLMFLPSCFSAKHLKGISGFIKLQLSDEKQWPVHCVYRGGRAKLGKGWSKFTLENDLREGDVCVFELLGSSDIALKVTVFRVLESTESVNRVSFVSSLGKNRCRKCVAYLETTPKHVYDPRSKICKIEEVERIDNSLTETPSHFFKVILPATIEEKKLRIPEKFVRKFGDELSDVATLRVPNGQVWHVRLTKDGKKIWFHVGWHDFVKYHSICVGYFLVFKYGKNSNFDVLIFDTTACDIQYPYYCGGGLKNDENNFGSKRCKVEELDEIKTSDAIGDESEFKKAVCKVEISSSDEENERIKFGCADQIC